MRTPQEIATAFGPAEKLNEVREFVLVGIGGASMGALAQVLVHQGHAVRGSDSTASPMTSKLISLGVPIEIGHRELTFSSGSGMILTDAIDLEKSPEVRSAREAGVPMFRRSQLLGWLIRNHRVVAVTGTHGKTTTTALVAEALGELDPLVINGANVPTWDGAIKLGRGEWAVVEACEAYNSLHDITPEITVLTNLELDHEDFYSNGLEQLLHTVSQFQHKGKKLLYLRQDENARTVAARSEIEALPYGEEDWSGELRLPGEMNRRNAAAAMRVAKLLGVDPDRAHQAIQQFGGAERRMQHHATIDGIEIWEDYAHHPTEVESALQALRDRNPSRLIVVFQPHLYSRTKAHLPGFAAALDQADLIVLTDIYPAREEPMAGMSSARIAELTKKPTRYVPARHALPFALAELAQPGDLVVGMGAGSITEFPPRFIEVLKQRHRPKKRVAVLYGGDSAEREVSIHSGRAVHAALLDGGYDAYLVDVSEKLLATGDLSEFVGENRPDICFLAVHGTHAEDGALQGLLEMLQLPYTGSGIQSSAIAMDKEVTKKMLREAGIRVPIGVRIRRGDAIPALPEGDLVVKPNANGSTVGVSFVSDRSELESALQRAFQYDQEVLVEERIRGMEISVPVLGSRSLSAVEIVPATGEYDFAAKYTPGATEEICPARLSDDQLRKAEAVALQAHRALGCFGATRTDMMVRPNGEIVVLEVNTLPGMTKTSLLPKAAETDGISFTELCRWITEEALSRHGAKT
jgi:D-alanine--D-alanine ligase